jgi:predicted transposase YdaD
MIFSSKKGFSIEFFPNFAALNHSNRSNNMNNIPEVQKTIERSNDKCFKGAMRLKPTAIEYMREFCPEVAAQIELDDLTLKDTNFINETLEEFYSDVIYETYLKETKPPPPDETDKEKEKRKTRIILLFEHKKGIGSYFDLFLQILTYIVNIWTEDRKHEKKPSIIIPLLVNQDFQSLKPNKSLHDVLKHVPKDLLKYLPQLQCHVLNIHPLSNERILALDENGALRSLFLAFTAVEEKRANRIKDVLIEIFKFYPKNENLKPLFSQLFVFLMQEGYFSPEEIKKMCQTYLSPPEEEKMMTNAQIWRQEGELRGIQIGELNGEQRGIQIGEQRGIQIGEQRTKQQMARLVVFRGYFKRQKAPLLSDLAGLSLEEVAALIKTFNLVKKAWKKAPVNVADWAIQTALSETEINTIVQLLERSRK